MTYTYVCYFSDDALEPLAKALLDLQGDIERRRPFVSEATAQAVKSRLVIVENAIRLLSEPVPRSFE